MRCAILARKSNATEAANNEKSVAVQERECRALAAKHGWTVVEMFVEDAVSGALMTPEGRPELFRMLAACEQRPRPFDVVIVSHEDRLGRDTLRVSAIVVRLIEAGVRLFSVATGERRLDNPTDELLLVVTNFAGSIERHNVSRRVRAKHRDTIARGGWPGGKVPLGYEKVAVNGHSELRVGATAPLVTRIFTLAAEGHGTRAIARILNEDPAARSLRKWSGAGIRDTLTNKLYIGQITYGLTRDVKRGGKIVRVTSPEPPVTVERPDLRIISEELWQAVATRKAVTAQLRNAKGQLQSKPERALLTSKYLLSGFLECAACGGPMVVQMQVPSGVRGRTYRYYRCAAHVNKGACANNRSLPLEEIHEVIAHHLQSEVLTPERLDRVVADLAAEQASRPDERAAERKALADALRAVEQRLERLGAALEAGGELRILIERTKLAETERAGILAKMEHADGLARAAALDGQAKVEAAEVLAGWSKALESGVLVARQALRKLLAGKIVITPEPDRTWSYRAQIAIGRWFGGHIGAAEINAVAFTTRSAPESVNLDQEALGLAREAYRQSVPRSSPSWR
jgi:DNA invertase Pin-like site-specific DNA recombinase